MELLQWRAAPQCFDNVVPSVQRHHGMKPPPPGARASRPHKSWHNLASLAHLLHPERPPAAPGLCFGRAHAVPAGRVAGCRMAGKPSGRQRERMRAGRPRSQGVLFPSPLPLKGARAGLPSRSPADEAEPSRLVALPGPSCNFMDNSFFFCFREGKTQKLPKPDAFTGRVWDPSHPGPGPAFDATVRPGFWLWDPGAPPGSCRTGNRTPASGRPACC